MMTPAFVQAVGATVAEKLRLEAGQWARTWKVPSLPKAVEVRTNPRLRTTIARYLRDQNVVEVGARFLALRNRKSEVLAHELAHAAVKHRFGNAAKTHGKEWQALVDAVGFEPRARLDSEPSGTHGRKSVQSRRFAHRCPVCQMVRLSSRRVTGWRCRDCAEAGLPGSLLISEVRAK